MKLLHNFHDHAFCYKVLPSYMYYPELIFTFTFSLIKHHETIVMSF